MKTLLILALLLSAGPVLAQTKTQTQLPPATTATAVPPGWLLCMNPEIMRIFKFCNIFRWDGPAPVLGGVK